MTAIRIDLWRLRIVAQRQAWRTVAVTGSVLGGWFVARKSR